MEGGGSVERIRTCNILGDMRNACKMSVRMHPDLVIDGRIILNLISEK
jgi:hypothetical protein